MILNHTIYITDAQSEASKQIFQELENALYVQECKDDENSQADGEAQQSDLLENDEFPGGDKKQQTLRIRYKLKVFFNKKLVK